MTALDAVDYVVFTISLGICAVVGAYYVVVDNIRSPAGPTNSVTNWLSKTVCFKKATKEAALRRNDSSASIVTADYFMGGRNMPFVPTLFSIFASFFSAITLLGLPEEVYVFGTSAMVPGIAFIPASIFIGVVFIPIYYRSKYSSVYEYIEKRFDSVLLRRIATVFAALTNIIYAAVCAFVPCAALEQVTGVPVWVLIIGTGVLTIFYTAVGGLRAVVIVDTIQAVIMFAGIIIVLIVGSIRVGGMSHAWEIAKASGRTGIDDWRIDLTVTHSFWSLFFGMFVYWIACVNNQACFQRTGSFGDARKAMLSMILVGPLVIFLMVLLWLATILAFAYFSENVGCDPFVSGEITSSKQIMSYFVSEVMDYPGFLGLYFASIFSGALSSMSTCYNTVSSLVWEDFLKNYLEPRLTQRQITLALKSLATILGAITVLLSITCEFIGGTAMTMGVSLLSGTAGTLMACFLAAAFLPFITSMSLIVSVLLGFPFVTWVIISQIIYKLSYYPWLPFADHDCPFNETVSSLLTRRNATKNAHEVADALPDGLRDLFSLSFFHFTTFCVVAILGLAVILSVVSRLSARAFPNKKWLRSPEVVNPDHLALKWFYSRGEGSSKQSLSNGDDTQMGKSSELAGAKSSSSLHLLSNPDEDLTTKKYCEDMSHF